MPRTPDELILRGTLIPVGRDFHAKVGQHVIVVAGLAVGIYTGDTNVPLVEETPTPPPRIQAQPIRSNSQTVQETREEEYRPRPKKSYSVGALSDGSPIRTIIPTINLIRGLLEIQGFTSMQEIRGLTGIMPDHKDDWRIRMAVGWLKKNDELVSENAGAHNKRRYTPGPNLQHIERKDTP